MPHVWRAKCLPDLAVDLLFAVFHEDGTVGIALAHLLLALQEAWHHPVAQHTIYVTNNPCEWWQPGCTAAKRGHLEKPSNKRGPTRKKNKPHMQHSKPSKTAKHAPRLFSGVLSAVGGLDMWSVDLPCHAYTSSCYGVATKTLWGNSFAQQMLCGYKRISGCWRIEVCCPLSHILIRRML